MISSKRFNCCLCVHVHVPCKTCYHIRGTAVNFLTFILCRPTSRPFSNNKSNRQFMFLYVFQRRKVAIDSKHRVFIIIKDTISFSRYFLVPDCRGRVIYTHGRYSHKIMDSRQLDIFQYRMVAAEKSARTTLKVIKSRFQCFWYQMTVTENSVCAILES